MKKSFLKLITVLSTAYLGLFAYGLLYSNELIFLPQAVSYQWSDKLIRIKSVDAGSEKQSTASPPGRSHFIVARHFIQPDSKYTILYSHGNASDIGRLYQKQQYFYDHGFSIIAYDYSGYGLSEGKPSEQQVYNDIKAVYDYLLKTQKLKPQQIISYGHSLGSAVATDLAFKNPVAGLILESPFVTAFRVKTTYPLLPIDKFTTIDKIDQINAPLFVLHSRDDPIIPFWHGETLFDKAEQPKLSLWLDSGGHSSVYRQKQFMPEFNQFISLLK